MCVGCTGNVNEFTIRNADGVIASARFEMPGVEIKSRESIVWTFKFGPDCVFSQNADLSTLTSYCEIWNETE